MKNQEIKDTGLLIKNEQHIGGNTALRVGGVIEGIGYALDNKDAANGYYQATINGGSISVNAPNFVLGTSGNLRLKMPAAGTTASTLTIGNANAVQLWYNGAAVSAQNTWEADEIISVFYDGTRFMASNSQGGGGKAEKIKYDNSQSGLVADNVQEALDEIGDELHTQSNYPFELGSIDGSNGENVTRTDGTRIRTIENVPKSSSVVNFTITRSCTRVSIILYENGGYKGWIDGAYTNISAGSYTYEVNVNYTWDSYRIACITSGYTSQNLDGNYCIWYSSIKDNVLQLDEDVRTINNALPHGDAGSVSLELNESDYAYGNISGTNGSIQPNDKVIYLVNALDVRNASSLSYSLDNSYRLGIAVYDKNGFVKKDEWFTGSGTYQLGGAMSIRIVIAYPVGGSTFDYESANPHFLLYLNGLKQVASLDDVNDLYEHYDDALYFGEYNRFELGSIDGSNGNNVESSGGTRIRTKGYVKKGDGIARLTFAIPITRMWIVLYKDNEYVGWIDGAYTTTHAAGYYEYKINTQYDYDTYRIACVTSGATSETANNTYVYNPALTEYIYNKQDSRENINIEALNTSKIYEYYDALTEKFPNYISKRVLGMNTSGQHEIREYVATLRDNYAYLYKERCYAWKNGSTTIFTESISPRVGDATYSDQLTTSTGYTVSASNCNNLTITVNGTTYSRQESEDIAADIQFRSTGTSSSITVSGKTYNRLPDYDKSSTCKKTIVSICNEHGPGINGDPREPSVVMFYLLQALCGETSENPQLDWLKRYAKLVIIPVSNPYAYDEEGNPTTLGNLMGRVNPNGVNINRNYPTTNWSSTSNGEAGTYGGSEIETQYNINCIMRHNADVAIDEHCLGPNTSNYNKWYYEGSIATLISQKTKMMMLATYNLAYNSYGSGEAGRGDTWIEQHDIDGCLLEMNQGYANTLHSDIILMADRHIWLGVLEYYDIFSL